MYPWSNAKIIASLSPIVAYQLFTWNIISLFEHFAPSFHLSLCVMPLQTIHPRGVAGFILDGNFIERRILATSQSRSASGYIYLVLLGGKTFRISNARPCIRTLAHQIWAVGYLVDVYHFPNTFESIPPKRFALHRQDRGHCPYHNPT